MNDLHPIFAECCTTGSSYDISEPFVVGGRAYATDGRIIIRGDAGGREPTTGRRLPPVDTLHWPRTPMVYVPLPDVGSGTTACTDCDHGDAGGYTCPECDGTGTAADWTGVPLTDTLKVGKHWIALLRRNGVLTVAEVEQRGVPAAYFAGDGFYGILMGQNGDAVKARGFRAKLCDCENTLLCEIAEPQAGERDVAQTYRLAMESDEIHTMNWTKVNAAIKARWGTAGLIRVKEAAHSGACFAAV
jgi:hypothetical protein